MSWFNDIITGVNTGVNTYNSVNAGGGHGASSGCHAPSGCFQCQMSGQGDIAGCIDALLVQYHAIEAQGNVNATLQAAQNALTAISNPAYLKQSDAYVIQAKAVFQHAIQVLQSQGATGTTTVMVNANGQTVTVPAGGVAPSVVAGIPNTYLIGGAVAVLGLVYLLKK